MNKRVSVNFKETLKLDHNIGGYVARITSPKGVKRVTDEGSEHYEFHTDSAGIPDGDVYNTSPGIYQVIDICKWNRDQKLQWNIYLVVVYEDGSAVPVAEYLDNPHTQWVKKAIKLVKAYFNDEELPEIELTPQPTHKRKTGKLTVNFMNPPVEDKPKKKEKPVTKENKPEPKKAQNQIKKPKKKPTGRPQEKTELEYGYARLMTFTGMVTGVYKILRHNKRYIEVETQKGVLRFSKEDGKQVNAEKPRYANKIEWNLNKEV